MSPALTWEKLFYVSLATPMDLAPGFLPASQSVRLPPLLWAMEKESAMTFSFSPGSAMAMVSSFLSMWSSCGVYAARVSAWARRFS